MALTVSKVDVWAAEIQDTPGALASVLAPIAAAGGDLECVIARREKGKAGVGTAFVSPVKGRAVQNAAKQAGLKPAADIATLRVEGPNKTGIGHRILQAISDTGVNMRGVSALVIGNKFAVYIGFDNANDANAAAKAIKAADKPQKRPAARKAR